MPSDGQAGHRRAGDRRRPTTGPAVRAAQASVTLRAADRDDPPARERTWEALAALEGTSGASSTELREALALSTG